MIKGLGIDLVKINRIQKMITKWEKRFLNRVFTEAEITYCLAKPRPGQHFAARFAAKEAALKMLATGLSEVNWHQFEVTRQADGKPGLKLAGRARQLAAESGIKVIHLSISHEKEYAIAQVIGEG